MEMTILAQENEVLCNMCGQSCTLEPGPLGGGQCGLINADVRGSYNSTPGNGSGALDDGVNYKFSLCEFCLDWLFWAFVIPVELQGDVSSTWKPAITRVMSEKWRQNKDKFYEEWQRRENCRRVYIHNKLDLRGNIIKE